MDLLLALLYGVSAQRPGHTLSIGGDALPLEARMGGLFLGFVGGILFLAWRRRLRSALLPAPEVALACGVLVLLVGVDGLNAFLFDGRLAHLYEPSLPLRLLTGLGAGLGIAFVAMPVQAGVIWAVPRAEPSIRNLPELAAGIGAVLAFGALMLANVPVLFWPLALAMAAAVLVAFAFGNLYLLALGPGWVRSAGYATDLVSPIVVAVGLALLELAALATLRGALASFGWSA